MDILITLALFSLCGATASIVTMWLCKEDKLETYYRQIQAVKAGNERIKGANRE